MADLFQDMLSRTSQAIHDLHITPREEAVLALGAGVLLVVGAGVPILAAGGVGWAAVALGELSSIGLASAAAETTIVGLQAQGYALAGGVAGVTLGTMGLVTGGNMHDAYDAIAPDMVFGKAILSTISPDLLQTYNRFGLAMDVANLVGGPDRLTYLAKVVDDFRDPSVNPLSEQPGTSGTDVSVDINNLIESILSQPSTTSEPGSTQ